MPKRFRRALRRLATPRLNAFKFGIAGGIVCAVYVLISTLIYAMLNFAPMNFIFLTDLYGFIGYNTTIFGIFLGTFYGFVDGFIMTGFFAWIYNKLL